MQLFHEFDFLIEINEINEIFDNNQISQDALMLLLTIKRDSLSAQMALHKLEHLKNK